MSDEHKVRISAQFSAIRDPEELANRYTDVYMELQKVKQERDEAVELLKITTIEMSSYFGSSKLERLVSQNTAFLNKIDDE